MENQENSSLLVFQTRSYEVNAGGAPWLISFGDLLTLLLCLFLAIISLSPLAKPKEDGQTPVSTNTLTKDGLSTQAGTWFANSQSGVTELKLELKEEELSNNSLASRQKALLELKDAVSRAGYTFGKVMIESCSNESGRGIWELAQARAQVLSRQLFDVGFSFQSIKTRVLGPHCEALSAQRANKDFEIEEVMPLGARIRFSVTRTHG